jgi:hypothetical protein
MPAWSALPDVFNSANHPNAPTPWAPAYRGQVRSMWEWARDLDRQEPLWFEFARPIEIDPGSLEDIAIQLTEGWILGSSPTVRRSVTDRSAPLTWIGDS